MLYTVLPGLTLCMTLLKNNTTSIPSVNVPVDSRLVEGRTQSSVYLDAAMVLIQAAKQTKIREEAQSRDDKRPESVNDYDALEEAETDSNTSENKELSEPQVRCPMQPMDCEELLTKCGFTASGVYRIWPYSRVDTGEMGVDVYCDMDTDGGGWTVFQRRDDFGAETNFFYQDWLHYKYGFGHLDYDFWLGNDKIFALSNQRKSMLRIDLIDFEDQDGYATYDNFYLDDEREGYRLHIGDYRGNIGDSFRGHDLCKFSTKDRDNDRNSGTNCAQLYRGGWWYNNCHTANLNGLYLKGDHSSYADGVNWHSFRGFRHSLKKTEMKVRSSKFLTILRAENVTSLQAPFADLSSSGDEVPVV